MKCEECGHHDCYSGKDCFEVRPKSLAAYAESQTLALTRTATALESQYYNQLTRVEEVMHFADEMGWRHLGIAFCIGLAEEARVLAAALQPRFTVTAACCKIGGVQKEVLGLEKIMPERREAMCNPVAQALRLNEAGTELNLLVGLCVGHDIIFGRESRAPVTTLVVKDRVLAHNPVGALQSGYWRSKLGLDARGRRPRATDDHHR
jgi:uncharacterized metal-binding protein